MYVCLFVCVCVCVCVCLGLYTWGNVLDAGCKAFLPRIRTFGQGKGTGGDLCGSTSTISSCLHCTSSTFRTPQQRSVLLICVCSWLGDSPRPLHPACLPSLFAHRRSPRGLQSCTTVFAAIWCRVSSQSETLFSSFVLAPVVSVQSTILWENLDTHALLCTGMFVFVHSPCLLDHCSRSITARGSYGSSTIPSLVMEREPNLLLGGPLSSC